MKLLMAVIKYSLRNIDSKIATFLGFAVSILADENWMIRIARHTIPSARCMPDEMHSGITFNFRKMVDRNQVESYIVMIYIQMRQRFITGIYRFERLSNRRDYETTIPVMFTGTLQIICRIWYCPK